jgi:hypothetical protein
MSDDLTGALWAAEPLRRVFAEAEGRMGDAMEQLVAGKAFAGILGQAAENAVALSTINAQVWDLVLRNLRVAGRGDIHRLGRRLNGIDDKLEMLLQELETLADDRRSSAAGA